MTGINEVAKEIHENARAHGWWDEERGFPRFGISTDLFNERAQTAPQERSYSI